MTSLVLKEKATCLESEHTFQKSQDLPEPDAGQGKLRYIAGACIAKSRYHYMKCTRSSLYKLDSMKSVSYIKVKMLEHLIWNAKSLEASQYKNSLNETKRRQNMSTGLTNISDDTFNFFVSLNDERKSVQNEKNFALHGSDCMTYTEQKLLNDKELLGTWKSLFKEFNYHDNAAQRNVHTGLDMTEVMCEIFHHVVRMFSRIGNSQFRRDMLLKFGKEKSERLRKKVVSTDIQKKHSTEHTESAVRKKKKPGSKSRGTMQEWSNQ